VPRGGGAPYAHEPMHVHPHCHCTQEPVVRDVPDRAARATGPEIFARMTRAEQDQALGPARGSGTPRGRVAVIPPVMGQLIAGPDDVGPGRHHAGAVRRSRRPGSSFDGGPRGGPDQPATMDQMIRRAAGRTG
jgi:hypothetical protein